MSTISKTLVAAFVGILVGGGPARKGAPPDHNKPTPTPPAAAPPAYVMAAPPDNNSPSPTAPAAATTGTMSNVDVSGPCDEAEHANDPRCAGPQRPEDNGNDDQVGNGQTTTTDDGPGHDVGDDNPGEHQNSGPGSQNSGRSSTDSDDGQSTDDGAGHNVGDDHGGDSGSSGSSGSGSSGSGGSGSSHSGGSDDD